MELVIGDERVKYTTKEKEYYYLGEGMQSIIYQYKDEALKIFRDDNNLISRTKIDGINENDIDKLIKINTNRILLPKRKITNSKGKLIGYTTKYLILRQNEYIKKLKLNKFKKELELLYDDINILSNNNIKINDLHEENFGIDKDLGLYIFDPGTFEITNDNIKEYNIKYFSDFIFNDIIKRYINLTKKEKNKLDEIYVTNNNICDIISDDSSKTVNSFVKNLVK